MYCESAFPFPPRHASSSDGRREYQGSSASPYKLERGQEIRVGILDLCKVAFLGLLLRGKNDCGNTQAEAIRTIKVGLLDSCKISPCCQTRIQTGLLVLLHCFKRHAAAASPAESRENKIGYRQPRNHPRHSLLERARCDCCLRGNIRDIPGRELGQRHHGPPRRRYRSGGTCLHPALCPGR